MNAFDFSFHVSMTLEMEEIVVQLNLCAQEDGSRRISCFNRCGQPPEIKKTPGKCGCDPICFLYNDCCEDLMVCPSVFYDAVKTFNEERQNLPESYCSKHKRSILTYHSCSEHFNTSAKTVEIYCESREEPFNFKAFQSILVALDKRQCLTGSLSTDEPEARRFCNRPEVIACEKDESPNLLNVFHVQSLCFGNKVNDLTLDRFGVGLFGMESISNHGRCRHMRLPSNTGGEGWSSGEVWGNSREFWGSKCHSMELIVTTSSAALTLYNFQSDSWGTFRCVKDHDWTCQVYECGQRRMIDTLSQTCYLPTYSFLAIFKGTFHSTEAANDTPGKEEVKAYDGYDKTSKGSS